MTSDMTLVGDVGGTNTRLGLVDDNGLQHRTLARYRNAEFADFPVLISDYLASRRVQQCRTVCLAFAAPISDEPFDMTNCRWRIDKDAIGGATGAAEVVLLNDLEALGHTLGSLRGDQVQPICGPSDPPDVKLTKVVLGAGTGFNAAAVARRPGGQKLVMPAECGHMTLPVETAEELSLRDYLAHGRGRASIERALSGSGVAEIHEWVCGRMGQDPGHKLSADIVAQALSGQDQACRGTVEILLKLLARVAGDLALAYLAKGGVYLSGGITRACLPLIASDVFRERFVAKGRQTDLLRSMPVHVITDDYAALEGCVAHLTDAHADGGHVMSSV